MNSSPDNQRDFDHLFDKMLKQSKKEVEQQKRQSAEAVRETLQIRTEILTLPGRPVQQDALRLAERHNEHLISEAFIRDIQEAAEWVKQGKSEDAKALMEEYVKRAKSYGFFLSHYSPEKMEEGLLDMQHRVVAEASLIRQDPSNPHQTVPIPGADCQCTLPDASFDASYVMDVPREGDEVIDENLVEDLILHPAFYGEVSDITSDKNMQNIGLAGKARSAAFHQIRTEINPLRGAYPIQKMVANIAMITGIRLPDDREITLWQHIDKMMGIKNERSAWIHLNSPTNPAKLAYILRDRKVPVLVNGQTHYILTDWFAFVHDLQQA